jgi:hypothetical protein
MPKIDHGRVAIGCMLLHKLVVVENWPKNMQENARVRNVLRMGALHAVKGIKVTRRDVATCPHCAVVPTPLLLSPSLPNRRSCLSVRLG